LTARFEKASEDYSALATFTFNKGLHTYVTKADDFTASKYSELRGP